MYTKKKVEFIQLKKYYTVINAKSYFRTGHCKKSLVKSSTQILGVRVHGSSNPTSEPSACILSDDRSC